jgi:ribosomal protein S18 acetylase RimI-like enzyme
MVKKLKMSRKEESLVYLETVADLIWLNEILKFNPIKYSVVLNGEEVAKIIFYEDEQILRVHDIYVTPRYRKQKLAKALIIEMLSDNSHLPTFSFHTRESNKPVHNLAQFLIKAYNLPEDNGVPKKTDHFYVDGGNAVIYNMQNPAYFLKQEMDEPQRGMVDDSPINA